MKIKDTLVYLLSLAVILLLSTEAWSYTANDLSKINTHISQLEEAKGQASANAQQCQNQINMLTQQRDQMKNKLMGLPSNMSSPVTMTDVSKVNGQIIQLESAKRQAIANVQNYQNKVNQLASQRQQIQNQLVNMPANNNMDNTNAIAGAEKAIEFAKGFLNTQSYKGMCLQFVANAYNPQGVSLCTGISCGTAKQCADGHTKYSDYNAPRGALVFFNYISGGRNLGHIGISLGDGTFIHASTQGVKISKLDGYNNSHYLGWSYPPSNKS